MKTANPMKIGVVGAGIVGGTLANYLESIGHHVRVDDPPKGINGDLSESEAIFICVPVDTLPNGIQDLTHVKNTLKKYGDLKVPFFIRSTVLPKTCDNLAKFFKAQIYSMPEFLTEREARHTFGEQDIICGVELDDPQKVSIQEERLDRIFPNKNIMLVQNREAELAKYAHNVMGAIKVNFFNSVAKYAEKIRADFDRVVDGVLLSGYINSEHTLCPGPDKKRGFAGKCFPKDTIAFIREAKRIGVQVGSIECTMFENFAYRTEWANDLKPPVIEFPHGFQLTGQEKID